MKVRVTQEHIDEGIPQECGFCPIAIAIRDQYPNESINVDGEEITIGDNHYLTPESAADFIHRFDFGGKVSPFEFELGDVLIVL